MNSSDLPVAILAGGLATRLHPITEKVPKLLLEVADLPADPRLRNVQLQRGAREVLGFSHGHEVTEMAEFHAPASMLIGYAEAR